MSKLSTVIEPFHYERCELNTGTSYMQFVRVCGWKPCKCKTRQDASKTATLRNASVYSNTVNQPNLNATLHMRRTQLIQCGVLLVPSLKKKGEAVWSYNSISHFKLATYTLFLFHAVQGVSHTGTQCGSSDYLSLILPYCSSLCPLKYLIFSFTKIMQSI